jgi:hypothetical protein
MFQTYDKTSGRSKENSHPEEGCCSTNNQKRPTAAAQDDDDDDNAAPKMEQTLALTSGGSNLASAALNLKLHQKNAWKNYITGPAPQELKDEWAAVTNCGFGNQKKLSLFRLQLMAYLIVRVVSTCSFDFNMFV